jgi:ketosteroid isomerase-like protein
MQKIFLTLGGLFIFLGFGALAAAAQDKTVDKTDVKQLEAIYRAFDAATKKRDLKTYEKYLDEVFELEQDGGRYSRAQTLEILKQFFSSAVEIAEAVSKIEKIRTTDGNYFLEVSSLVKGKFKMPDGKISGLEITANSTDVWIKTEKGWRQTSQIDRGSKILTDGK